jgi:hypothetical protein
VSLIHVLLNSKICLKHNNIRCEISSLSYLITPDVWQFDIVEYYMTKEIICMHSSRLLTPQVSDCYTKKVLHSLGYTPCVI